MRTYPSIDEGRGYMVAFEIEMVYTSLRSIAGVLSGIAEVTNVRVRRIFESSGDIRIWFRYQRIECVVLEPFGDNSRYWIGPKNSKDAFDIRNVEEAFEKYRPTLLREVFGSILTLRLPKRTSRG
jgi:hypothetical protein